MKRQVEEDEFGNQNTYKVCGQKRCPICTREVTANDVNDVKKSTNKMRPLLTITATIDDSIYCFIISKKNPRVRIHC